MPGRPSPPPGRQAPPMRRRRISPRPRPPLQALNRTCKHRNSRAPAWRRWKPNAMLPPLSPTPMRTTRTRPWLARTDRSMDEVIRRVLVFGKVQGVYFRHSTRQEAKRLAIRGIARNLPDGSVEVIAQGDAAVIEELRAWLHRGP